MALRKPYPIFYDKSQTADYWRVTEAHAVKAGESALLGVRLVIGLFKDQQASGDGCATVDQREFSPREPIAITQTNQTVTAEQAALAAGVLFRYLYQRVKAEDPFFEDAEDA